MLKARGIIVLIIIAAAAFAAYRFASGRADLSDLRLERVRKGPMAEFVKLRGKVELDLKEKVYAKVPGTIRVINSKEGDHITAGAVMARIDTLELDIARRRAEAAYEAANSALAELRNSVKYEQLKQAEEQLAQASSSVDSAQKDHAYKKDIFDRMARLQKSGSTSEQDLKDARVRCEAAENALAEAKNRLNIAEYNLRLLQKGASEHLIRAAEYNADQARAQVEDIMRNIGNAAVTPEISGTVLARNFDIGAYVTPGVPLFEIGDYSSAYIKVEVLTDDLARIKMGARAVVSGDLLGGEKISGEVFFVAPKAFTKVSSLGVEQQKIDVRVRYDVGKYRLKPGYEFDVNIIAAEKDSTLFVPYKAVFESNGKNHVFAVRRNAAELVPVETGMENDENIEILKGLGSGEVVAVDPPNALRPGLTIDQKPLEN